MRHPNGDQDDYQGHHDARGDVVTQKSNHVLFPHVGGSIYKYGKAHVFPLTSKQAVARGGRGASGWAKTAAALSTRRTPWKAGLRLSPNSRTGVRQANALVGRRFGRCARWQTQYGAASLGQGSKPWMAPTSRCLECFCIHHGKDNLWAQGRKPSWYHGKPTSCDTLPQASAAAPLPCNACRTQVAAS